MTHELGVEYATVGEVLLAPAQPAEVLPAGAPERPELLPGRCPENVPIESSTPRYQRVAVRPGAGWQSGLFPGNFRDVFRALRRDSAAMTHDDQVTAAAGGARW